MQDDAAPVLRLGGLSLRVFGAADAGAGGVRGAVSRG